MEQVDLIRRLKEFNHAVLVNRLIDEPLPGLGFITVDDVLGAETAVSHLVEHGHRQIALLAGPQRSWSGRNRLQGFKAGIRKYHLKVHLDHILYCDPNTECGRQTSLSFLAEHTEVTAIVAYNDLVAVGILQACRELGRPVPDGLAVIGSDDIPLASLITPTLSTLHIPRQEIGMSAVQTLMAIMEGKSALNPHISFQPCLVIRESAP
jgi:DNA-binding LacI/PurR family transcriptional regulator